MTRDELIAEMERKPDPDFLLQQIDQWTGMRQYDAEQFRGAVADVCAAYFDAIDTP